MGIATAFVLAGSNTVISAIKDVVPNKIRIPVYIVVIATFVTVVGSADAGLRAARAVLGAGHIHTADSGELHSPGPRGGFRLQKTASWRLWPTASAWAAAFTLSLMSIGCIREMLTSGSLFEVKIMTWRTTDFMLSNSAPGAFILLGCIIAGMNWLNARKAAKENKTFTPPEFDCRSCKICSLSAKSEDASIK